MWIVKIALCESTDRLVYTCEIHEDFFLVGLFHGGDGLDKMLLQHVQNLNVVALGLDQLLNAVVALLF